MVGGGCSAHNNAACVWVRLCTGSACTSHPSRTNQHASLSVQHYWKGQEWVLAAWGPLKCLISAAACMAHWTDPAQDSADQPCTLSGRMSVQCCALCAQVGMGASSAVASMFDWGPYVWQQVGRGLPGNHSGSSRASARQGVLRPSPRGHKLKKSNWQ